MSLAIQIVLENNYYSHYLFFQKLREIFNYLGSIREIIDGFTREIVIYHVSISTESLEGILGRWMDASCETHIGSDKMQTCGHVSVMKAKWKKGWNLKNEKTQLDTVIELLLRGSSNIRAEFWKYSYQWKVSATSFGIGKHWQI